MTMDQFDRQEVERLTFSYVYAAKHSDRFYRSILTDRLHAYGVSSELLDQVWDLLNPST